MGQVIKRYGDCNNGIRLLLLRFVKQRKNLSIQGLANFLSSENHKITRSAIYKILLGQFEVSDELLLTLREKCREDKDVFIARKPYRPSFQGDREYLYQIIDHFLSNFDNYQFKRPIYGIPWDKLEELPYYLLSIYLFEYFVNNVYLENVYRLLIDAKCLSKELTLFLYVIQAKSLKNADGFNDEYMGFLRLEDEQEIKEMPILLSKGILGYYYLERAKRNAFKRPQIALTEIVYSRNYFMDGGYLLKAISTYLGQAGIVIEKFDIDKGLQYLYAAKALASNLNNPKLMRQIMANIAHYYATQEKYKESKNTFDKAFRIGPLGHVSRIKYLIALKGMNDNSNFERLCNDPTFTKTNVAIYNKVYSLFRRFNSLTPYEQIRGTLDLLYKNGAIVNDNLAIEVWLIIRQVNNKLHEDPIVSLFEERMKFAIIHDPKSLPALVESFLKQIESL